MGLFDHETTPLDDQIDAILDGREEPPQTWKEYGRLILRQFQSIRYNQRKLARDNAQIKMVLFGVLVFVAAKGSGSILPWLTGILK